MTKRYFSADLPPSGGPVVLSPEEAAHAARVMRARVGDEIVLFDGLGSEAIATIQAIDKRQCVCRAQSPRRLDREPPVTLHLGVAFPKTDRARELVERLTELGVRRVTPLLCEHSQRPPSENSIDKLRRVVIEACKQSGRNVLMQIDPVKSADAFFSNTKSTTRWIAHPGGEPIVDLLGSSDRKDVVAAVGPEGGFSEREVCVAEENHFQKMDLGKRIYRIETAAVVIAAGVVHSATG